MIAHENKTIETNVWMKIVVISRKNGSTSERRKKGKRNWMKHIISERDSRSQTGRQTMERYIVMSEKGSSGKMNHCWICRRFANHRPMIWNLISWLLKIQSVMIINAHFENTSLGIIGIKGSPYARIELCNILRKFNCNLQELKVYKNILLSITRKNAHQIFSESCKMRGI